MTNRGAEANQRAAQSRAESYWLVYQALGPGRSLSKLHRVLADLGLDVSVNTLKGYSVRYKWQERSELVDGANTAVELATYLGRWTSGRPGLEPPCRLSAAKG